MDTKLVNLAAERLRRETVESASLKVLDLIDSWVEIQGPAKANVRRYNDYKKVKELLTRIRGCQSETPIVDDEDIPQHQHQIIVSWKYIKTQNGYEFTTRETAIIAYILTLTDLLLVDEEDHSWSLFFNIYEELNETETEIPEE